MVYHNITNIHIHIHIHTFSNRISYHTFVNTTQQRRADAPHPFFGVFRMQIRHMHYMRKINYRHVNCLSCRPRHLARAMCVCVVNQLNAFVRDESIPRVACAMIVHVDALGSTAYAHETQSPDNRIPHMCVHECSNIVAHSSLLSS